MWRAKYHDPCARSAQGTPHSTAETQKAQLWSGHTAHCGAAESAGEETAMCLGSHAGEALREVPRGPGVRPWGEAPG